MAAGLSICPADLFSFSDLTPPHLSRREIHIAQSHQSRSSWGAGFSLLPSKCTLKGAEQWVLGLAEGYAPRAAAQDAMKAAWKQAPLPNSLQRVPGWSHLLLLYPAATSCKLHVLASHCLSPGGCNVGCHITRPDCLLCFPGCCFCTGLERWTPHAGCTT